MTRCSCWHQNFVAKGLSAPAPGLYTCIKSWKKYIKSDFKEIFLKLVAKDRSDKRFLLTSKFCPLGMSALTCGYIHLLNHEKMCINSEVEEILFKLATNDHQNFGPNGLSARTQGLCLNFFSSITADFNISSAVRWAIQGQWSSGFNKENDNFA